MSGPSTGRGLASIIIPCLNQLNFTRQCVAALLRHTRAPFELIFVDNGSDDGTAAYLTGVQDAASATVKVLRNAENRGFPAACNQGLAAARGEYLVLLNNDAVVTDGWLDQLVALADSDASIGMTGPMSNYVSPPQSVGQVSYADLEQMQRFAAAWRAENRGTWFTTLKLSGFCLLVKRRLYDAIGGLDERFGIGMLEDDDYAARARRAGFQCAVARDLFVHHFGSRTFVGAGIDAAGLLKRNTDQFVAKWGEHEPLGTLVHLQPWSPQPPAIAATALSSEPPKVTLTMIVRNEESNLPACLESAADLFDEIVVVDTGSTDRTIEIAQSFGARVFDFVWVDDFAAARNASLARARGDYAFWLDADDVLDPRERDKLRTLLRNLRAGDDASYVVRCACDSGPNGEGGRTVVDHVRLFPLREQVRWRYRVHEQILPSLRRSGINVRWSDVTVRHTGYVDTELRQRKLQRDEAILRAENDERPGDPFVLFNLGSIATERKDWSGALQHLRASLAASAPTDSITRKLYALIARSHQMLGQPEVALAACAAGLANDPEDAELLFRVAVIRRHQGDAPGAEATWRKILTLTRPEQFSSVDMGIYGHLTRRNLARLVAERGDPAAALQLWREVLAECPDDPEALEMCGRLASTQAVPALRLAVPEHES